MFASKPGRVLLAGAALVAQAGPAHAAEALPLAEAVLRQVTAAGLGSPATPQWPREQADRLVAVRATAGIDPMRSAGDFQASMNSIRSPAGSGVPANSQGATNLTLAVTLNGTPFFASVRQ